MGNECCFGEKKKRTPGWEDFALRESTEETRTFKGYNRNSEISTFADAMKEVNRQISITEYVKPQLQLKANLNEVGKKVSPRHKRAESEIPKSNVIKRIKVREETKKQLEKRIDKKIQKEKNKKSEQEKPLQTKNK